MKEEWAIREASACVSPLYEITPGRWSYHLWSPLQEAWLPGVRTDTYAEARRKRVSSIAAMAAALVSGSREANDSQLGWDIVELAYSRNNTGTARERLRFILRNFHKH